MLLKVAWNTRANFRIRILSTAIPHIQGREKPTVRKSLTVATSSPALRYPLPRKYVLYATDSCRSHRGRFAVVVYFESLRSITPHANSINPIAISSWLPNGQPAEKFQSAPVASAIANAGFPTACQPENPKAVNPLPNMMSRAGTFFINYYPRPISANPLAASFWSEISSVVLASYR